jgi:hypothetical protein
MSWIRFSLTLALVAAASVSAALVQGRMRQRWGPSEAVRAAAARLQDLPADFGDWHMTSSHELDEESRSQLKCVGEVVRVYANAKTGDQVALLLILGPTGPTAVHTPEICLGQREFAPLGDRREIAVGSDRFWNKRFKSRDLHGGSLSVYWAWNTDGHWLAPQNVRYTFVGLPFLYKVQVTCGFHGPADNDPNDAGQRFLADFVPVVGKYIISDILD